MPKSESPRIDALEALLAERRRHEGYLAKLEERRAGTPEHVYVRLRDEYATKLTDLQVRAAAEAEAIAGSVASDESAVSELEARLASVTEERIEGELRAEVGEYDPKEWSKKLTVLNATIAQLEKERDGRLSAFERTRALLDEATRVPGAPAAASAAAPAPAAAPPPRASGAVARPDETAPIVEGPSAAARAAARPPAGPPSAPPMAGGPSFDELAFLNSVVGRASAPVASGTNSRPPTPSRPLPETPAVPVAPPVAAEAPRESKEPASGPSVEPSSAPTKEPATAPRASGAIQRPADAVSAPAPLDDEPPSPLGRPTPRTSQAIKTLKCQECGTLNYPTEWYCERCGGELAAL